MDLLIEWLIDWLFDPLIEWLIHWLIDRLIDWLILGTNCNTVVSLDCGHVSQTTEDFTTVRCQVNNMRSLYESLDDVCVKDVLEGNNMYKCGQCDREVRAEKQACFRSLPEILVLNTMRYSFNHSRYVFTEEQNGR